MTPIKGYIKVKIETPKEVVTAGGIIIPIEQGRGYAGVKNYQQQRFAPTHGEVVAVGSDCGVKVGDIAMFHFTTEQTCKQQGRIESDDDSRYFYIEADKIVCVKRGDQLLPLDGWIIAEHAEKAQEKTDSGLFIPESAQKTSDRKFKVVAVHDGYEDCEVGDVIYTEKDCDIPIQIDNSFNIVSEKLFKIETKNILAFER
mgnify:CR=1 FL=1|jgi:co-chaperonin GroES (HSP10)